MTPCALSARDGHGRAVSRKGEIAIAKRIEAGREAMIAGLCESPLTFQAIIIWRDELNEARSSCARHHRSRGDLCRPDAKVMPAPVGPDGQPLPPVPGLNAPPTGAPAPPSVGNACASDRARVRDTFPSQA